MSYAPGFEADVFISFAGAGDADTSWLEVFKFNLIMALKSQLDGPDPVVYARGGAEQYDVSPRDAATLIAVVSPGSELTDDLSAFLAASAAHPSDDRPGSGRLFKLVRRPLEEEPEAIASLPPFEYLPEDDGDLGKSGQQTMLLGAEVAARLKELKESDSGAQESQKAAAERVQVTAWLEFSDDVPGASSEAAGASRPGAGVSPEAESDALAGVPAHRDKPYIFILHAAEDGAAVLPLRAHLERDGRYEVWCSADFATADHDTQQVQEEFDMYASDCDACLLFYGNAGKAWVANSLRKFAQAQDKRSRERSILARALLCIPPEQQEKADQANPPRMGSVTFVRYTAQGEVFKAEDLDTFLNELASHAPPPADA